MVLSWIPPSVGDLNALFIRCCGHCPLMYFIHSAGVCVAATSAARQAFTAWQPSLRREPALRRVFRATQPKCCIAAASCSFAASPARRRMCCVVVCASSAFERPWGPTWDHASKTAETCTCTGITGRTSQIVTRPSAAGRPLTIILVISRLIQKWTSLLDLRPFHPNRPTSHNRFNPTNPTSHKLITIPHPTSIPAHTTSCPNHTKSEGSRHFLLEVKPLEPKQRWHDKEPHAAPCPVDEPNR